MTTSAAIAKPSKIPAASRGVPILESLVGEFDSSTGERVDTVNHVIRGVKVVGLESVNIARTAGFDPALGDDVLDVPYGYAPEALREAVPLYENVRVFIDHPPTEIDRLGRRVTTVLERSFRDHAGRLINARFVEGRGIFADLEYLESEPLTKKLVESALRMPEQIALSHRSYVLPVRENNRAVVKKIQHVPGVDIVAENPGTTETLFESAVMTDPVVAPVAKVAESDGMIPGEMEATPTDPKAALTAGVKAAVNAVIDGDGTAKDKAAKIASLLDGLETSLSSIGAGPAAKPAAEATATETKMETKESADAAQLRALMAKQGATQVLETAGVKITSARINVIAAMPEAERAGAIEQFKALDAVGAGASVLETQVVAPRSGGAGPNTNVVAAGTKPNFDADEAAARYAMYGGVVAKK